MALSQFAFITARLKYYPTALLFHDCGHLPHVWRVTICITIFYSYFGAARLVFCVDKLLI